MSLYIRIVRVVSAAYPPDKAYVEALVKRLGDDDGLLGMEEFKTLCIVLIGELSTCIGVQALLTFVVAPPVAVALLWIFYMFLPAAPWFIPSFVCATVHNILQGALI